MNLNFVGGISILVFGLAVPSAHAALRISSQPTANMNCSSGICSATAEDAVLNATDLASMLAGGDITVSSGSGARDIDVDAAFSWTSAHRLTLDAFHAIAFKKPVVVAGTGALTIVTNDGGSGGDFSFSGKGRVELWDLSSSLVINGNSYKLIKSLKTFEGFLEHGFNQGMYFALVKNINAAKHHYRASPLRIALQGTFEGLGNAITGLTIEDGTNANVGLFSDIGNPGTVRNVNLEDADVEGFRGEQRIGALAGMAHELSTILGCHVTGHVADKVQSVEDRVGALVGASDGLITRSFAIATVAAGSDATSVGGLVGQNDGTVDQSYAASQVSGADGVMTGGLVGYSLGGAITNSYAVGQVTGGNSSFVGGLLGSNQKNGTKNPAISNSYSTGAVSGGTGATVGGAIGEDLATGTLTNVYWDTDTSAVSDPSRGAGNIANDPGVTGLTTEQLTSGLPTGFGKKIWKEKPGINGGYPYLIVLPPA